MWSSDAPSGNTPARLTRPYVGFRPTVPHHAEGMRMEPPVSVPRAAKQSPAATATPDPLDEPPVLLAAFQGLMGMGRVGW
jgi:hypothetical protein